MIGRFLCAVVLGLGSTMAFAEESGKQPAGHEGLEFNVKSV